MCVCANGSMWIHNEIWYIHWIAFGTGLPVYMGMPLEGFPLFSAADVLRTGMRKRETRTLYTFSWCFCCCCFEVHSTDSHIRLYKIHIARTIHHTNDVSKTNRKQCLCLSMDWANMLQARRSPICIVYVLNICVILLTQKKNSVSWRRGLIRMGILTETTSTRCAYTHTQTNIASVSLFDFS